MRLLLLLAALLALAGCVHRCPAAGQWMPADGEDCGREPSAALVACQEACLLQPHYQICLNCCLAPRQTTSNP